jgi:putative transposase
MTMRKINYRLYPNAKKEAALFTILRLQKDLYNAALQERIECYQKTGKGLSYNDQQKSLTQIRADSLDYKNIPIYISRMTLQRLHKAFNAFFKRVKRGQTPGFPRFKSIKRFTSFEMCAGSGWSFDFSEKSHKHGTLFIRGVGHIKARGQARTKGVVKTSQVVHKYGQWYLSVSVNCNPVRETQSTKAPKPVVWIGALITYSH